VEGDEDIATSRLQQARNARARALGFRNDYDRRIASGRARGQSRQVARGHHADEPGTARQLTATEIRRLDRAIAGARGVNVNVLDPTGAPSDRKIQVLVLDRNGKARTLTFDVRKLDDVMRRLRQGLPPGVKITGSPTVLDRRYRERRREAA
jgi:hypothetical protein